MRRCSAPPSGRTLVEKQPMGVYCASRNAFREARVGDVQGDAGRVASGRRYGGGGAATIRKRLGTCAAKV